MPSCGDAFGCIVFSDDTFRIVQESMDHAANLIDDAFKCGGHRVLNRPLGRVRDKVDYPYYSMEFADGGDLSARIEERRALLRGKIPWDDEATQAQVVEEFRAILAAVAHLHTRMDFVHRDIKPNSVLLVGGRLRLADFGLVKNLRPGERRVSSAPPGTPFYRAPEQERGDEIGRPADVYSLGVVLAELATGALPEPKTDATRGSTLDQYRDLKRVPERSRDAYAKLGRLPSGLRELIARCTDVRPDRRPQDAADLQEEFERVVTAPAAPASPGRVEVRSWYCGKQHPAHDRLVAEALELPATLPVRSSRLDDGH